MHDEMHVRQLLVDLLDDMHRQDRAVGLAGELVGAVRGAHGDGERIDLGLGDELHRLVRVGQELVVAELALEAVAVLLLALAALQRAEHAELALDRDAAEMGHLGHRLGDADIVVPVARGLAVGLERAVHHHRGEAGLDRGHAGRRLVAVVEMHADRDMRIDLGDGVHHVLEHDVVGVAAGAARGLDDDGRVGRVGRRHDRQRLLHVVDVEGGHAVIVLGGMIEQLAKRDAGHDGHSPLATAVGEGLNANCDKGKAKAEKARNSGARFEWQLRRQRVSVRALRERRRVPRWQRPAP